MIKQKEEGNNMKQNVHDSDLKYQDFLILAYFKANYKKYEFNDIAQMMGMTHATMRKSIEHLLELKYLICINDNIVISKVGEGVLEEKGLSHFFCNNEEETIDKNQLSIDEPYVPINFKM